MAKELVDNKHGYEIPVTWVDKGGPVFVILPALGVAARFYTRLVDELAGRGYSVALCEQRGHGDSSLRPSRTSTWDFVDVVDHDIPAILGWVQDQAPGRSVYLLGHSIGGHYATMAAGLYGDRIDGLITAACGTPWLSAYSGEMRGKIRILTTVIPIAHRLLGYYPGEKLGFSGTEARGVMSDWRHLALTNRFRLGKDDQRAGAAIAAYDKPGLVLRMADDDFAPEKAVEKHLDRFTARRPEVRVLSAADIGDRADHFRWARKPGAVVDQIEAVVGDWV